MESLILQEKKYVGIDLGKRSLEMVRLDEGPKIQRASFKTDRKGVKNLLSWLRSTDVVGIEACALAFHLEKVITKEIKCKVVLLNAGKLYAIYRSMKKTDKEDALKIARLIQRIPISELPTVTPPGEDEEQARVLSSEQQHYKKVRTLHVNRLHSIFVRIGETSLTRKDLQTCKNREKCINLLQGVHKEEAQRIEVQITICEETIKDISVLIKQHLKKNAEIVKILYSMPGIGPVNAIVLLGYLYDGKRFSHPSQVSYYAGLVPRVDCSGDTVRYGKITKTGCRPIRAVLIQAAWALIRSKNAGKLGEKYNDIAYRRGKGKAIVAIARKMLEALYVMVRDKKTYKFMNKEKYQQKLKFYGLIGTLT